MIYIIDNNSELKLLFNRLNSASTIIIEIYLDNPTYSIDVSISGWLCLEIYNNYYLVFISNLYKNKILNTILNTIYKRNIKLIIKNYKKINYISNKFLENKLNIKFLDLSGLYYSKFCKPLSENVLFQYSSNLKESSKKIKLFNYTRNLKNILPPDLLVAEYLIDKIKAYKVLLSKLHSLVDTKEYNSYIYRIRAANILENSGLAINKSFIEKQDSNFIKNFKNIKNNIITPEYYLDTSPTGRFACKFKDANLMAINKSDRSREVFTSRFSDGKLFLFDYDGMHLRILFHLLNITIPDNVKAHNWFAKKYHHASRDTVKNKIKNFSIFYGTSKTNDENFNNCLDRFKTFDLHKIRTPLNRKIESTVDKDKRLNYLIQKFEVDCISKTITDVHRLITANRYKSRQVLYQYDSVLIDMCKNEIQYIDKIKEVFETILKPTKLPVNIRVGETFDKMSEYNE